MHGHTFIRHSGDSANNKPTLKLLSTTQSRTSPDLSHQGLQPHRPKLNDTLSATVYKCYQWSQTKRATSHHLNHKVGKWHWDKRSNGLTETSFAKAEKTLCEPSLRHVLVTAINGSDHQM